MKNKKFKNQITKSKRKNFVCVCVCTNVTPTSTKKPVTKESRTYREFAWGYTRNLYPDISVVSSVCYGEGGGGYCKINFFLFLCPILSFVLASSLNCDVKGRNWSCSRRSCFVFCIQFFRCQSVSIRNVPFTPFLCFPFYVDPHDRK